MFRRGTHKTGPKARAHSALLIVMGLIAGVTVSTTMVSSAAAVPSGGATLTLNKAWSGGTGQVADVSARTSSFTAQALDDFDGAGYTYANSVGTLAWGFPWVDSEGDGPDAGRIRVEGERLRFQNLDTASITRRVDLTGVIAPAAISFDYVGRDSSNGEDVIVEVSANGTDFVEIGSISGSTNPGGGISSLLPIPDGFVGADTAIRFRSVQSDQNWDADEWIEIDDVAVNIYEGFFGSSTSTGSNVDLIGSFTVQPGDQVTIAEVVTGASDPVLVCSDANGDTVVPLSSTALGISGVFTVPGPDNGGNITCTLTNDGPVSNPDLQASCGVNVTVILDESGSIDSDGGIVPTENAVKALANGLAGTGSFARFVEFSTNARDSIIGGTTAPTLVTPAYVTGPLSAYLDSTSAPQNADGFEPDNNNPLVSTNNNETFTNWEAGLYRAGTVPPSNYPIPPLVVFITDGNPNTIGTDGTSTNNNGGGATNAANAALEEIDAIKSAGAHVLGIGVGGASNDTSFNRLVNLIEPGVAQTWEGVGPLDIRTVDAIRVTNFVDLENALAQVASELCSHSLDITKVNQDGEAIEGRSFTTTVAGIPAGEENSFNFIDPAGDDGPPSATDVTEVDGSADFQWTPVGEVPTPADWTSTATFTEQLPPGWTLPANPGVCTVAPGGADVPLSASVDGGGIATFTLGDGQGGPFVFAAGQTVSCTITNNEPGTIKIEKFTDPASSPDFTFTPGGWNNNTTFDLAGGEDFTSGPLAAGGVYTIAETALPAGWAQTDATCTNGTPGAIVVEPGETTTCTFTNREAATITVEKQTLPDGDPTDFDFTTDFDIVGDDKTLADGESFSSVDLAPGTYTISETVPANWNLTDVSCQDADPQTPGVQITVTAGQTVDCVFTNTKNGTIEVKKASIGGTGDFGFTGDVAGTTGTITTTADSASASGNTLSASVVPGTYSVTESSLPAGWDLTGATCSPSTGTLIGDVLGGITVDPGETVTCTFTNTRRTAELTIDKTWIDAESGDVATISIDGINDASDDSSATGADGSETDDDVAGTTVFAGETVTISEVLAGANTASYGTTLFCGDPAVEVSLTDGSGTLAFGDNPVDTTCTFTNTAERGTIIIQKAAIGGADTFDFTGDWAGLTNGEFSISTTIDGINSSSGNETFLKVLAGSYEVEEVSPVPFWDLTTLVCSDSDANGVPSAPQSATLQPIGTINLDAGETVTCTYTNTQRGSITIVKDVANTPDGFSDVPFTFTGDLGAFSLTDDDSSSETVLISNLTPGAYSVVESNANTAGFALTGIDCGSATLLAAPDDGVQIDLQPGENVTCTFTNTASASLVVDKDVRDAQPVAGVGNSFTVTYDIDVTNNGPGDTSYDLDDTAAFGDGATITNITVTSAQLGAPIDVDGPTFPLSIVTNEAIAGGGAVHSYVVVVTFDVAADMTIAERVCGDAVTGTGQGTFNTATVTLPDDSTISDSDCADIPDPAVTVDKDVRAGQPVAGAGNSYTVTYDIDVTNAGPGQTTYTLSDTPDFGDGTTITDITVTLPDTSTAPLPLVGGTIVTNDLIDGGATESYVVVVTFDVAATMTSAERECGTTANDNGQGTFNSAAITFPGGSDSDFDCADIPDPAVTVDKEVRAGQPVAGAGNSYTVTYDIDVTNAGPGQTTYTLSDTPDFGDGTTITDITVTLPDTSTAPLPLVGGTIVTNDLIDGGATESYVVVVTFDVAATMTSAERECGTTANDNGQGTFNSAAITFPGGSDSDFDCADIPDPAVTVDKEVRAGQPVAGAGNSYTVTYDIDVTNAGPGQTTYTLSDTPDFGDGTTITDITVTLPDTSTAPLPLVGGTIVTNDLIDGGATESYVVVVTFDVAATMTSAERECGTTANDNGQGTFNSAAITFPGGSDSDFDCADIPDPEITTTKTVASGPTFDSNTGEYTITYDVVTTNNGEGPGTFTMVDDPAFGDGVNIVTIGATSSDFTVDAGFDTPGDTVVTNEPLAAGAAKSAVITITFTVDADTTPEARDCVLSENEDGTGTLNTVTVTPNIGTPDTGEDCTEVPDPEITTTKTVASGPSFDSGTGEYTISYDVVTTNNGEGPGTFTMVDDPAFGDGVNIVTIGATSSDFTVDAGFDTPGDTVVANEPLAAGAAKSAVITITFTVDADTTPEARDCVLSENEDGTGTLNTVTVTPNIGTPDTGEDCGQIPSPGIGIVKTLVADPTQPVQVGTGFQYTVDYVITVSNTGESAGTYDLDELPTFAAGVVIDSVVVESDQLDPSPVTDPTNPIVDNEPIAVDGVHTYDVTITFTVPADLSVEARDCVLDEGENGTGTLNTATVTPNLGDPSSDDDCVVIPDPEITTTKTVASGPSFDSNTGEYTITYDVVTTNNGEGPGTFTMVDDPAFGDGVNIVTIGATSSDFTVDAGFDTPGDTVVANEPLAAGAAKSAVITITFTVDADTTPEARDCVLSENEDGTGTLNTVTVTPNIGTPDTGEDCTEVPDPEITTTKTVVSDPAPTAPGSLSWTVEYEIETVNNGDGPGTYDLDDVPGFPTGLTITDREATSTDITINGDFNTNAASARIANDVEIAAGETQVVTVVVTFDFTGDLSIEDRECGTDLASGKGTYNSATVTPNIGDPDDGEACGEIPDPDVTITKTVSSEPVDNNDGTFTVEYQIDVTNAVDAGTGTYDLVDLPVFSQGVTIESKSVSNTVPGSIITEADFNTSGNIALGEEIPTGTTHTYVVSVIFSTAFTPETTYVACGVEAAEAGEGLFNEASVTVDGETISDDDCTDLPGDLTIDKTDGGVTAIAGGAPFTYTLTVTNIGGTSTGEPVVVTDVLPAEFEWVSFPEDDAITDDGLPFCVQTDQTLTCTLDPGVVDTGGKSTSFEVTAQALAGIAPSVDGYQNLSYVDSPDDPAPETPECPIDEIILDRQPDELIDFLDNPGAVIQQLVIGGNADNNVACDETPVIDGEIEVSKTDNIADTDQVINNQEFTYTLNVTNIGTSPLDTVTLADDLPVNIELISVAAGTGWTCNDADPIACAYAPELAAGDTTTDVVLTVKVGDAFVGAQIDNEVTSTAIVRTETDSKTVTDTDDEVTPLEPTLDVNGFVPVCVADAPAIQYNIVPKGFDPVTDTATLTVLDANGDPIDYNGDGVVNDADNLVNQPLSGSILWPGARVVDGAAVDWPGWRLVNGLWEIDPTDDFLRDGVFVTVSVNPEATTDLIAYPPSTSACADPEQTSVDLQIVKTATADEVEQGETATFNLVVTNNGPDEATEVVVTDNVPTDLSNVRATSSDFTCSVSGNAVTCTRPSLAVGASGTITVTGLVVVAGEAVVTNTATVTGRQPDSDPTNNSFTDRFNVPEVIVFPPQPPPTPLPETGSNINSLIAIALTMLMGGFALVLSTTRRRRQMS